MKVFLNGAHVLTISGVISQSVALAEVRVIHPEAQNGDVSRVGETPDEARALIREGIEAAAGDTLSLLGTASDGAQLLLFHMATLVKGLSTANSLAEVRDATDAFMPLADAFLGKVAADEVKLPFKLKGEEAVMAEIETRATAVAEALIASQNG